MLHLGLDIGYGQTKLAWSTSYGSPTAEVHPSGAAPFEQCDRAASTQPGDSGLGYGEEVLLNGRRYGSLIDPDRIRTGMQVLHEDYSGTPEYMALYLGALSRVGAVEVDHLVTGLPVAQCKDRSKARMLKAQLEGVHQVRTGFSVNVRKVTIVPQAIGAYLASLDKRPSGSSTHDTLLVIDFGHFSVDWVLISAGAFRDASSSSSTQGGSYVIDKMVSLIKQQHGIAVSRDRVYGFVRDGLASVQLGREIVDLKALKALAAKEVAPAVIGQIRASLRDQSTDVNRVLVCGGSTPFFEAYVQEGFPRALYEQTALPVLANANGFRLYARKTP